MRTRPGVMIAIGLLVVFAGCVDSVGVGSSSGSVASIAVAPAQSSLQVGASSQLAATLRDSAGNVLSGRPLLWSTNATSVATVNGSGLVTAAGEGTAAITATSEGQSGTATVTVTQAGAVSLSKQEPVYDPTNPDHKLHVEETWANLTHISNIDVAQRSDGGAPWYDRGAKRYGAVVNEGDGFGSVRHVTLDYTREPPIAPHGSGAHAAGYHWAGANSASFDGDDNANIGPSGGTINRGFDLLNSAAFLNKPDLASVVYEFAVRMRGINFYVGKSVDINSGQNGGVGRFNYDPYGAALGIGRTFDCSESFCQRYYSNNGTTLLVPGAPDHHTRSAPQFSRSQTAGELEAAAGNPVISYKQNKAFGNAAGQFSWGPGPSPQGPDESNPYPNADLSGTGKRMWEAGWLYHKIRITREPATSPYQYGRGRIEMWIGKTPGALVKIMEYFGDAGEFDQGQVWIDPTGSSSMLGNVHFFSLAARNFRGGAHVDVGTIRIWSHSRR